jgi:hypothetical protein
MMRPPRLTALAVLLPTLAATAAGCAVPPRHDPTAPVDPLAYDGGLALAIIGTPFYALAKATTCVASALVATPSSAGLALSDRPRRHEERQALQAGVATNCGGPYWLHPAY